LGKYLWKLDMQIKAKVETNVPKTNP